MYSSNWFARVAVVGTFVAALTALPATAHAQMGTLAGKVVDPQGKPVVGALVVFDNPSQASHLETKTDKKGEWVQPGLVLGGGPGAWTGVVKMEGFQDTPIQIVQIRMNSVTEVPPVTLRAAVVRSGIALKGVDPAKKAQTDKLTLEVGTALEAKDYDLAITKLNELNTLVEKCSICYTAIGDANLKKGNNPDAEAAYLKSVELDDKAPEPYEQLANIYNQQRKFDEAAKMSEKAMSLKAAKPGGGGAMDAEGAYNAAVIAFNGSKIPEARTYLERVLQLNPNHAEAHYLYGMVLVNQNKVPEAKKELQKYLELSPTGANAETAKAIIALP